MWCSGGIHRINLFFFVFGGLRKKSKGRGFKLSQGIKFQDLKKDVDSTKIEASRREHKMPKKGKELSCPCLSALIHCFAGYIAHVVRYLGTEVIRTFITAIFPTPFFTQHKRLFKSPSHRQCYESTQR